jgi:hypothetical protein
VLWNLDPKTPSNLSSPLLYNGRLYLVKSGGMSSCYDAKDGKTLWDRSRLGNFGDYFASPVAADGKVYVAGKNGFVVVLEDGPELKVLAKTTSAKRSSPHRASLMVGFMSARAKISSASPQAARSVLAENSAMRRPKLEITSQPSAAPASGMATPATRWARSHGAMTKLEMRLQQLKKLGYTTVAIPKAVAPFTPIHVDGDTAGRKAFRGAKTFDNPDVAAITARFREKAAKLGFEIVRPSRLKPRCCRKMTSPMKKPSATSSRRCAAKAWPNACGSASRRSTKRTAYRENDPKLGIPAPDMLTASFELARERHLPEWLTQVKTHYTTAMNEMYRANTRAREGSRSLTLYQREAPGVHLPLHQRHRVPLQVPRPRHPRRIPRSRDGVCLQFAQFLFRRGAGLQRSWSHRPAQ